MKSKFLFYTIAVIAAVFIFAGFADASELVKELAAYSTSGAVLGMGVVGKFRAPMQVTPQDKLAAVANSLGNPGLKKNQGSTLDIYHYLPVATSTQPQTLEFFKTASTTQFPFTNLQDGKLQVGEGMVVTHVLFTYMTFVGVAAVPTSAPIAFNALQVALPPANLAQFSYFNDNDRTIKELSLVRANTLFNTQGATAANYAYELDTYVTIQTLINFTLSLKLPILTVADNSDTVRAFIGCHLIGPGALLNTKRNY